jgi:hypothetical protein
MPQDHARDARDVDHRSEVARPGVRRVHRGDRDAADPHAEPPGGDQRLALEYEPASRAVLHLEPPQERRGVDAKARLAVVERLPSGPADEEVRDAVRGAARARRVGADDEPGADHDVLRMRSCDLHQPRDVLRRVLAVTVERDHARGAERERVLHAPPQARALAAVALVPQQHHRQAANALVRAVGRAIVHDDHGRRYRGRARDDVCDRRGLVAGRDHDCVALLGAGHGTTLAQGARGSRLGRPGALTLARPRPLRPDR